MDERKALRGGGGNRPSDEPSYRAFFFSYIGIGLVQLILACVGLGFALRAIDNTPFKNHYLAPNEGVFLGLLDVLIQNPTWAVTDVLRDDEMRTDVTNWWMKTYEAWAFPPAAMSTVFLFMTALANFIQAVYAYDAMDQTSKVSGASVKAYIQTGEVPSDVALYRMWMLAGRNPVRWVEYSFSASWMLLLIATLSTVSNVSLHANMFALSAFCMIFGYYTEVYNPIPDMRERQRKKGGADFFGFVWSFYLLGWVAMSVPWTTVFYYFLGVVSVVEGVPATVYAIVFVMFLLFSSFALVLPAVYLMPSVPYYYGEVAYMVLSASAKVVLAAMVFFGDVGRGDAASF